LLESFYKKKAELVVRMRLLDLVDSSLYAAAVSQLDSFDDLVSQYCAAQALPTEEAGSSVSLSDVTGAAISVHLAVGSKISDVLTTMSHGGFWRVTTRKPT
jgi:hypothetical protein